MTIRSESGSATVEAVIGATAMVLFLSLAILGGRIALARQAVESAAADAARAASIERTQTAAQGKAETAARASLANQKLVCASTSVVVDTSGFTRPVGVEAWVSATVRCDVPADDLGLPGASGSLPVEATVRSALDTYRAR